MPVELAAALADRYRLERELGACGMATVWLARDLKHARPVAVLEMFANNADVFAAPNSDDEGLVLIREFNARFAALTSGTP